MSTEEATQALLDLSESVLNYIRTDFNACHEDQKDDLQEQCEGLLQYAILLDSIHPYQQFGEFIDAMRQVLSAMSHAQDLRSVFRTEVDQE